MIDKARYDLRGGRNIAWVALNILAQAYSEIWEVHHTFGKGLENLLALTNRIADYGD